MESEGLWPAGRIAGNISAPGMASVAMGSGRPIACSSGAGLCLLLTRVREEPCLRPIVGQTVWPLEEPQGVNSGT